MRSEVTDNLTFLLTDLMTLRPLAKSLARNKKKYRNKKKKQKQKQTNKRQNVLGSQNIKCLYQMYVRIKGDKIQTRLQTRNTIRSSSF